MKCTTYYFRPLGLLLLLCLIPLCSIAQNITVKGIVKDNLGESVIGANVTEKGTTNGMITDLDGNFSLTVQKCNVSNFLYRICHTRDCYQRKH